MKKKYMKYGVLGAIVVGGIIVCSALGGQVLDHLAYRPEDIAVLDLSLQDNEFYIDEANYVETMQEVILPYLEQHQTTGYLTAEDGAQIYYEQYLLEGAKNHVIILHGFTESSHKYREVIYYFMQEGYSVSIMDHRGHGQSEREVEDISKVHIDDFDTYVSDLKAMMDEVIVPSTSDVNFFLYAHSMGGGIGSLFLEQYPDEYFTAAVLSTPMMEIHTGSVPKFMANAIANFMNFIGKGESYILGQGPYEGIYEHTYPTSSQARTSYVEELKASDETLQVNGGSFTWLKEGFEACEEMQENAGKATTPIMIFQASDDTYVLPEGHYIFVNGAPNTELVLVENSQHEIYLSKNEIMVPYFNTIFNFFEEYAEQ